MSNTVPTQQRSIDPYSSYNSNTFNAFTRIVTGGDNALLSNNSIEVLSDSTSPETTVIVTPGICFKDDVMINFTAPFEVDFTDVSFYDSTTSFDEEGYYYVLLNYTYAKSIPAPQASIRILKPSQRMSFSDAHLMLKIVEVSFNGVSFEISDMLEYDPEIPDHKRQYTTVFASLVDNLPTYDPDHDRGMILYDRTHDLSYMGMLDGWRSLASFDYPCDAHLCSSGQLAYLDASGVAHPGIATSVDTFALGFVIRAEFNGLLRLSGFVSDAVIETGNVVAVGDRLFLSSTVPGAVTNIVPTTDGIYQAIGKCFATDGTSRLTTVLCTLGNTANVIPPHNDLGGIQGGDSTDRYHLNLVNYNHVNSQDFTHNNLTSKQGGDGTNFYHLSQLGLGAMVPVGTILAFFPGYFTVATPPYGPYVYNLALIGSNDYAAVDAYLVSIGGNFRICSGIAPNDPESPIWNVPGRRVPDLRNDRFLKGSSQMPPGDNGCYGGSNALPYHSHTVTVVGTAISVDQMPPHDHDYTTYGFNGYGGPYPGSMSHAAGTYAQTTATEGGGQTHTHAASTTSSTGPDITPQYMTCYYIIRIK